MKLTSEIFGIALILVLIVAAVRYFLERARQKKIDAAGTVVYATFLSSTPVKFLGKPHGDFAKIRLRLQEPGVPEPREVTISTRVPPGQAMQVGMKVPVVIDPKNPKRVYPASPEAAKRAVMTGSRDERRMMQTQLRTPGRGPRGGSQPSGYTPPNMGGRRR
jgi:hypothetical protein